MASKRLEDGKAPGLDGLPAEFYKYFWNILGPALMETLLESLDHGELPLSYRRAVLCHTLSTETAPHSHLFITHRDIPLCNSTPNPYLPCTLDEHMPVCTCWVSQRSPTPPAFLISLAHLPLQGVILNVPVILISVNLHKINSLG